MWLEVNVGTYYLDIFPNYIITIIAKLCVPTQSTQNRVLIIN